MLGSREKLHPSMFFQLNQDRTEIILFGNKMEKIKVDVHHESRGLKTQIRILEFSWSLPKYGRTWCAREQNSHSSGVFQVCAFLVILALVASTGYSRQSRQDYYSSSHQCWYFLWRNDRNIAWNFLWGSASWHTWSFDQTIYLCQPWRNRCVASLLWRYAMQCRIAVVHHGCLKIENYVKCMICITRFGLLLSFQN